MTIDAWPTSVWVAAALGPLGAYLLYGFIKESKGRSGIALAVAAAAHVAFVLLIPAAPPKRAKPPRVMEIELVAPEPPPPPPPTPPEPKPEPEPEPTPQPEAPEVEPKPPTPDVPPEPKPRKARKTKTKPKTNAEPAQTPKPAGPKRFDLSQLNLPGDSGVSVNHGSGGGDTLGGDPRNNGKAKPNRAPAAPGKGSENGSAGSGTKAGGGKAWAPASQVFISQLPMPRSVPKRQCPATKDGVEGTVFLKVQVRRDGTVRKVTVTKGIGNGCDAIAVAALKKAKFKAARSNANKNVDFEIRYEYAFSLTR